VDTEVGERLSVSKRAEQKFRMEGLNLKKPNDFEVKEQSQVKISNRFAALVNLCGAGGDNDDGYQQGLGKY